MSRISELFSRDILNDKPHTDEELQEIITYLKGVRLKWEADNAAAIARGLPPLKPPWNWTKKSPWVEKQEAKAAEREAKAAAKAAKAAERKRSKVDPRQLDLEEAIAASAGDAEKDAS
jgi:hypothetical protein